MNATNFGTNKDFRRTVDIRQKVRHGKIERKIYLPPEDFAYGLPNRPPTPFKDVIYNAYGNRAEDVKDGAGSGQKCSPLTMEYSATSEADVNSRGYVGILPSARFKA